MDVENSAELTEDDFKHLKSFSSPWKLIKKALSSILVALMIAAGVLVNWLVALGYLFSSLGAVWWIWFLGGLLLLIVIFPLCYLFLAYGYGQSALLWETYREGIRPLAAKVFSASLDKFLVDNPDDSSGIDESEIVKEVEKRQKHFLERLPDFISAYFKVFFTSGDIINIVKEQRKSGLEKKAVKKKAMNSFFESLDLQMAELLQPSLYFFYILGAINIIVIYFLF